MVPVAGPPLPSAPLHFPKCPCAQESCSSHSARHAWVYAQPSTHLAAPMRCHQLQILVQTRCVRALARRSSWVCVMKPCCLPVTHWLGQTAKQQRPHLFQVPCQYCLAAPLARRAVASQSVEWAHRQVWLRWSMMPAGAHPLTRGQAKDCEGGRVCCVGVF